MDTRMQLRFQMHWAVRWEDTSLAPSTSNNCRSFNGYSSNGRPCWRLEAVAMGALRVALRRPPLQTPKHHYRPHQPQRLLHRHRHRWLLLVPLHRNLARNALLVPSVRQRIRTKVRDDRREGFCKDTGDMVQLLFITFCGGYYNNIMMHRIKVESGRRSGGLGY